MYFQVLTARILYMEYGCLLIPTISLALWLTGSSIIKSEIAHSLSFFAKWGPALFIALMPECWQ